MSILASTKFEIQFAYISFRTSTSIDRSFSHCIQYQRIFCFSQNQRIESFIERIFSSNQKWTNLWGRTTSSVLLLCPLSVHPRISTTSFLTEYTGKTTIDPRFGTFGRNNFFSGCINKNCLLVRNHEETTNE